MAAKPLPVSWDCGEAVAGSSLRCHRTVDTVTNRRMPDLSDIISVEHLAYTYPGVEDTPGVPVFADLNLTIEEGSFVAVLGTNGCGKSTLAKHFNAILLPSGGKVYVCGIDTANEDRLITIRRNVGMVFQNPDNQIVANVVEEDVAFGLRIWALPARKFAAEWTAP